MRNQNNLHALQLERLRRDIREGLDSGPARRWRRVARAFDLAGTIDTMGAPSLRSLQGWV
jgi:hypothetical protein